MEGERGRKESNWLGLERGAVDEAAKQAQTGKARERSEDKTDRLDIKGESLQVLIWDIKRRNRNH